MKRADMKQKATRISWLDFTTPQMRAFHMSWVAFFFSFFAWFGVAPFLVHIREELNLTEAQIGNTMIASVAATVFGRILMGWLCDRIGPRLAYTWLLLLGSIPVMGIGLSRSYESFLIFRLAIGAIGASFVITQYHTSAMFAHNVVGTANATTAGWGNLGAGAAQFLMPLGLTIFMGFGVGSFWSWRLCMLVAGAGCFLIGLAYFRWTTDTPNGNFKDLRKRGAMPNAGRPGKGTLRVYTDFRVWVLFVAYGACFGVELTMNNIMVLYFFDYFGLGLAAAGIVAALFGLMNIFARTLGGYLSDFVARRQGVQGRVRWLTLALAAQGVALMIFSQMAILPLAIAMLMIFSVLVKMAQGATFSVVPFVRKENLGSVAGLVGAGGNMGAIGAAFLFRGGWDWPAALLVLGGVVFALSFLVPLIRLSRRAERDNASGREQTSNDDRAHEVGTPEIVKTP